MKIPFENLREKTSFRNLNIEFVFISGFFGLLSFLSFLWRQEDKTIDVEIVIMFGAISFGFLLYFILARVNQWKFRLSNNQHIYMNKNIPSYAQTEDFINSLYTAQKQYLRTNYLIIDSRLDYEKQVETLKWLKSLNAISQEEFNEYYNNLKKLIFPDKKTIGFDK